ncbi:MAG TPA: EamA family transporter [bacterium]|nr:EamA family transporter [bacterium]
MRDTRSSGTWLVILAALLWSTGGAAIKYVDADGAVVAAARCLIAGLVFLPFIRPGRVRFSWKLLALMLCYPLMSASFVIATKWTTAMNAVAIQYTAPLWIFLALAAAGTIRPTARRAAPMVLAAFGIILFLLEPAAGTSLKGNLVAIVSGVGFALVIVLFRALRDEHSLTLVSLSNLATALVLFPYILHTGQAAQLRGLDGGGWLCLLYLGAFQIGLAYVLYSRGLRTITALKASTISLIEPVLNPVWAFIIMSELPSGYGVAGAVAILGGVTADAYLNPGGKQVEREE